MRMRSSTGGSKRATWLVVLLLCTLAYTCNATADLFFTRLNIRKSRLIVTDYDEDLRVTTQNVGTSSNRVLSPKARKEVIRLLKQAWAWNDTPTTTTTAPITKKKEDLSFEFFSAPPLEGGSQDIFIFRSTKADGREVLKDIFLAMERHERKAFKTPFFFASSKGSDDHFLGYMIPGTNPPLPHGVVQNIHKIGFKELSPSQDVQAVSPEIPKEEEEKEKAVSQEIPKEEEKKEKKKD